VIFLSNGADWIDLRGKVVMPGLIDVHVHIAMWAGEVDWGNILDIPDEYLAMRRDDLSVVVHPERIHHHLRATRAARPSV